MWWEFANNKPAFQSNLLFTDYSCNLITDLKSHFDFLTLSLLLLVLIQICAITSILIAHSLKIARRVSLFTQVLNELPSSCFPALYNLGSFKRRVNDYEIIKNNFQRLWCPNSLVSLSVCSIFFQLFNNNRLSQPIILCSLNDSICAWIELVGWENDLLIC